MSDDITILRRVQPNFGPPGRLYYYRGNFYYPWNVTGPSAKRVYRAIRQFKRENEALVAADRSRPDYKTLPELADG